MVSLLFSCNVRIYIRGFVTHSSYHAVFKNTAAPDLPSRPNY